MLKNHVVLTLKWTLRDHLLHAILGVNLLVLFLIPVFSLFSMRQVQELAITLCLSLLAVVLLALVLLLGGFSLWREVDRRYTASVLTLPASRASFVLGRFIGILLFLLGSTCLLSMVSAVVILSAQSLYPSDVPPHWGLLAAASAGILGKFIVLTSVAVLFSSVSTSFFLPFFGTLSIYLAGSASQQVYEYIIAPQTADVAPLVSWMAKLFYYLLPNLSVFDFKIQAIYGLPLDPQLLFHAFLYLVGYSGLCVILSIVSFSRRQFS